MKLHLLENRNIGSYTTFGSYWDKGETTRDTFRLTNAAGEAVPVQTEIAARWADGSIKWARHTADARKMGCSIEVLPGEVLRPAVLFVLLNPSTAGTSTQDGSH